MPIIRATFFFEDDNKHGWTETIHTQKPDLTTAIAAARALADLRRNCLGDTARITYIRVSDDLVKRDSKIHTVPSGDGTTRTTGATAADIANTAVIVRIEASPLARRTLYMRGVPDEVVTRSGKYTPTGGFSNSFDMWANDLIINNWACRSRDGTNPLHTITDITQVAATGVVTITTIDAHLFELNTPFVVRGVRGAKVVNGTWTPFSIPSATTVTIKITSLIGTYTGGGTAAKLGYILAPITDVKVIRVSHRNAGRPFDSPRGRRSKARPR